MGAEVRSVNIGVELHREFVDAIIDRYGTKYGKIQEEAEVAIGRRTEELRRADADSPIAGDGRLKPAGWKNQEADA